MIFCIRIIIVAFVALLFGNILGILAIANTALYWPSMAIALTITLAFSQLAFSFFGLEKNR